MAQKSQALHHNDEFHHFEHARWEEAAEAYHRHWESLTCQVIGPMLKALAVCRDTEFLDVATGPGYVAAEALKSGAKVVGLDFSEAMVQQASKLHPMIEFRTGNAESLPFPDSHFDAVAINFGMLHFAHPESALKEALRVLRPGGQVAFTVWATPKQAKGFALVYDSIREYGTLEVPLPSGPPFFRFSDPDETRRVFKEAGFESPVFETLALTWTLPDRSAFYEAFACGTARTGPTLRAQEPTALKAIQTAIHKGLAIFEAGDRLEIPMAAQLAFARRP